jgi:hypothetical protein
LRQRRFLRIFGPIQETASQNTAEYHVTLVRTPFQQISRCIIHFKHTINWSRGGTLQHRQRGEIASAEIFRIRLPESVQEARVNFGILLLKASRDG